MLQNLRAKTDFGDLSKEDLYKGNGEKKKKERKKKVKMMHCAVGVWVFFSHKNGGLCFDWTRGQSPDVWGCPRAHSLWHSKLWGITMSSMLR